MIHYTTFTNTGKVRKSMHEETAMLYVEVFGNAEKIQMFEKENHRIWMSEPNFIDTDNYKGYYKVYADEIGMWKELSKNCENAEERMKKFLERMGIENEK